LKLRSKITSNLLNRGRLVYKGLLLIAVPLVFGIIVTALLTCLLGELEGGIQHELLLKEAMASTHRFNRFGMVAGCCADSYVGFNDDYYLKEYEEAIRQATSQLRTLNQMFKYEEGLQAQLKTMQSALGTLDEQRRALMGMSSGLPAVQKAMRSMLPELQKAGNSSASKLTVEQSAHPSAGMEASLRKMAAAEASAVMRIMFKVQLVLTGALGGSILLTVILAIYFSRNITGRLLVVLDNTIKLARGAPLNPPVEGSDEIAELDEFLYKSANEIRELERFKLELAGLVSHELKSPLTSVNTFLVSLSTGVFGDLAEKARDRAVRAEKSVGRLMGLIKDLINLDRLEVSKLEMSPRQVQIDEIVSSSVDAIKELAERKKVEIAIKSSPGTVYVDPDRLVQVIVNLVSNAMKFSPPQSTITVESCLQGGFLEIKVSDQGRGIPASMKQEIFRPFQQVEADDAATEKGTGLGLTICRNIVEQLGGKIGVDSIEGKGSTFWFSIPTSGTSENDTSRSDIPRFSFRQLPDQEAGEPARVSLSSAIKGTRGGLRILQKGLILISVPLVFELAFVALLTSLINQDLQQIRMEEHSRDVIVAANQLVCGLAEAASDGLLYAYIQEPELRDGWQHEKEKVYGSLNRLKKLTAGDETQSKNLNGIEVALARTVKLSVSLLNLEHEDLSVLFSTPGLSAQVKEFLSNGQNQVEALLAAERQKVERVSQIRARSRTFLGIALSVGIVLNIVISVALAVYFMRSITDRLRCVMANMDHLVKREPLEPPVAGGDEIAYLDRVLYNTAGHLSELERFKSELISVVSHELRTPLMSIGASLSLLGSGVLGQLSERALKRLRSAENETQRLVRLINDLLDIEKMQAGKFVLIKSDGTVADLLDKAIASVAAQAEAGKIEIVTAIEDITINADHDRLAQVIVNLLSNAIKFSAPGSTIKIEAICANANLELRVIDQGRGIPEHMQESIFERFVQVDKKDASEGGGSGLGLAICRSIIEQHSGMIGVESREGQGSTFWCRLPL
jgi:signal transduction histidine kinase